MKVLVTGNKGYIGSLLCENLLEEDFDVIGLDTCYYKGCNFTDFNSKILQIEKDIRNITKEDLDGIEAIIHLAALSNDPMGDLNPKLTSDINYKASVRLAKIAKEKRVKRFIFSSSCSVYGVSKKDMIDEEGELNPITEYAKSKVNAEKDISMLASDSFSPIFLRNSTVYGVSPMLRVDLVVNNLVGWGYTTGKIKIMSDGMPWRPLIHIQDICKAFIATLKAPRDLIHNQVFNVGVEGGNYQVKDIAEKIKKILPQRIVEYNGEHGVDSRTYKVDFTKFMKTLGVFLKPKWSMEGGIEELVKAYKRNNFSKEDFLGDKFTRLKRIEKLLNDKKVNELLFWKETY